MKRTLLALLLCTVLRAEDPTTGLTVREYRKIMASNNEARKVPIEIFIRGLGEGMQWGAYMATRKPGAVELYCLPDKLHLTPQNFMNIIDNEIREDQKKNPTLLDEQPVALILLFGLMETFPCKETK
jgi:hypothetical protein